MSLGIWKYSYIGPKIHGMITFMLTKDNFDELVKKNLNEVYSFLEHTPYQEVISAVPIEHFDSATFEKFLVDHFLTTFDNIKRNSPKEVGSLLDAMLNKFEVENLRIILRAKIAGLNVDETMSYIIPVREFSEEFCKSLLEKSENVEDIVHLLMRTDYGPALAKGLKDFEETGLSISLETALDQYVYESLWKEADKIGDADRKIAKKIIGTEIDFANMKLILRCKTLHIEADQTRKLILPIFFQLTEESINKSIEAEDVESALNLFMLRSYKNILSVVLAQYKDSNLLSEVEQIFDEFLLKNNRDILKHPFPFDVGVVMSFLNVKWIEVKNLRAIVKGKEDNVPEEAVQKKLLT